MTTLLPDGDDGVLMLYVDRRDESGRSVYLGKARAEGEESLFHF